MSSKEKVVLIGICLDGNVEEKYRSLNELERLVNTAGLKVAKKYIQKRTKIDASTFGGKGFLKSIKEEMDEIGVETAVFDNELSPTQSRNLSKLFELNAIDRTEVILDIFKQHAKTGEAKLQVKLAELEYQLPRLKKLWNHFEGERVAASGKGAGQASRGMGEKQIEVDKRLIRLEIRKIKKNLEKIAIQRDTQTKARKSIKKICLAGYTNAGKSTLYNKITNAGVLVEDKLFATLDSNASGFVLPDGNEVIISDTVGFIADLPHMLVASFRATLKEVIDADWILHVVDASNQYFGKQIQEVRKVLKQIKAEHLPELLIFNKIDDCSDSHLSEIAQEYPTALFLSAKSGLGVSNLITELGNNLYKTSDVKIFIPYDMQREAALVHSYAKVLDENYIDGGVQMTVKIKNSYLAKIKNFVVNNERC